MNKTRKREHNCPGLAKATGNRSSTTASNDVPRLSPLIACAIRVTSRRRTSATAKVHGAKVKMSLRMGHLSARGVRGFPLLRGVEIVNTPKVSHNLSARRNTLLHMVLPMRAAELPHTAVDVPAGACWGGISALTLSRFPLDALPHHNYRCT